MKIKQNHAKSCKIIENPSKMAKNGPKMPKKKNICAVPIFFILAPVNHIYLRYRLERRKQVDANRRFFLPSLQRGPPQLPQLVQKWTYYCLFVCLCVCGFPSFFLVVLALVDRVIVVRSGSYFIVLFPRIVEQNYKVWARSGHYDPVNEYQNRQKTRRA